ncbi:MAG: ComF family protein [Nitrospirae bacterium]|jgi:ComF family protein|nr:ComF family protein [Nitrospirota bacterium]
MWKMRGVTTSLKHISLTIFSILYPSFCPICGNKSNSFSISPICSQCWSEIKQYNGPSCNLCALPFISEKSVICGNCLKNKPLFKQVIAFGLYDDILKEAISQFKFYGIRRLAKPLGNLLLTLNIPETDAIIPVPITKKGLIRRGFNQSVLLGRAIACHKRIPLLTDVLFKIKETPPQVGLSASERLINLRGAFIAKGNLSRKSIILVDDVMTTGATVTECTKVLLKAGAKEVIVLVLARAGVL